MKPKHIALFLFAVLLLTACAPAKTVPVYYGRFLIDEEEIETFSEIIHNNDIDYDYEHKLQTPGDTNGGMAISASEYAELWKTEMEAQYEKLYTKLNGYVQNGEMDPARLTELSDAQTAFIESLKDDMTFVKNTLGMGSELPGMGTFGTAMINTNYANAYRQRTIDLMEYLYLINPSNVQFVYQNDY